MEPSSPWVKAIKASLELNPGQLQVELTVLVHVKRSIDGYNIYVDRSCMFSTSVLRKLCQEFEKKFRDFYWLTSS